MDWRNKFTLGTILVVKTYLPGCPEIVFLPMLLRKSYYFLVLFAGAQSGERGWVHAGSWKCQLNQENPAQHKAKALLHFIFLLPREASPLSAGSIHAFWGQFTAMYNISTFALSYLAVSPRALVTKATSNCIWVCQSASKEHKAELILSHRK